MKYTFLELLQWQDRTAYTFKDKIGREWALPLRIIVFNRSSYYTKIDGIDEGEAMEESLLLFKEDIGEIEDWARNNMDWEDIKNYAIIINNENVDMQDSWCNPEETRLKKL